ncbi:hypothetical protein Tsubulata_001925 [Turnera subulata]|uniref:Tesmin/TSO1-like CXC domain-containing protein n=1 Tax=Turnera subulata TaxID=218843 RepID=A0A9Q0J8Z6_9ROSI|nr:hypothetical protein Tsubulata_001925 [Turnera subulata]
MKKPNRRSKRSSVADSSSPATDEGNIPESQREPGCESRVRDLEVENRALKREIEELREKLDNLPSTPLDGKRRVKQDDPVSELKKKLSSQSKLSAQRHKGSGDERIDEIRRLKAQRVQLLCKIKLDSVQFRLAKASLEKEVLQLKKEQRRNAYEMHKLLTLNQRQKRVLQRKTEEASMATKHLNGLLESRKASSSRTSGTRTGTSPGIQGTELELKVQARVEEIQSEFERQMEEMADELRKFEEEAEMLKEENYRLLLQDKETECVARDSDLRDLKVEVAQLSNLVNQLGRAKAHVEPVKSSASGGSSSVQLDMNASESHCGENIAAIGKSGSGVCCSCSKKSLCKTSKCECRATQGSCGPRCGCAFSKCTNRELLIKLDDSLQLKQPQSHVHESDTLDAKNGIVTCQPAELNNDCQPQRKPLREVGNTLNNSSPGKPGKKARRQNAVTQVGVADLLAENAGCQTNAGKLAPTDIPVKQTRVTRSRVSN